MTTPLILVRDLTGALWVRGETVPGVASSFYYEPVGWGAGRLTIGMGIGMYGFTFVAWLSD